MTIKDSLTSRLQGHKSAPQPWKVLYLSQSHGYINTLNRCQHSVYVCVENIKSPLHFEFKKIMAMSNNVLESILHGSSSTAQ